MNSALTRRSFLNGVAATLLMPAACGEQESASGLISCPAGLDLTQLQVRLGTALGAALPADMVPHPIYSDEVLVLNRQGLVSVHGGTGQVSTLLSLQDHLAVLGYERKLKLLPDGAGLLVLGGAGLVHADITGKVLSTLKFSDLLSTTVPLDLFNAGTQEIETSAVSAVSGTTAGDIEFVRAASGDLRVLVSLTNFMLSEGSQPLETPVNFAQGLLLYFSVTTEGLVFQGQQTLNGFNVTALTAHRDGGQEQIIATVTGPLLRDTNRSFFPASEAVADPRVYAKLLFIDPERRVVTSELTLPGASATYRPLAITGDDIAFLGDAAYGRIYAVDLANRSIVRGPTDPILLGDGGLNYVADLQLSCSDSLLVAVTNNDQRLYGIDLTQADFPLLDGAYSLSAAYLEGLSGAGPLAFVAAEAGIFVAVSKGYEAELLRLASQ